jgi:hypothetical protein
MMYTLPDFRLLYPLTLLQELLELPNASLPSLYPNFLPWI